MRLRPIKVGPAVFSELIANQITILYRLPNTFGLQMMHIETMNKETLEFNKVDFVTSTYGCTRLRMF